MTKYDSNTVIKAISSIISVDGMNDNDKLDIIKRMIEIVNNEKRLLINATKTWYLWDAKKENVDVDFVPENIKGKKIDVRYVNGNVDRNIESDYVGFNDDYGNYNVEAYRVAE